MHTPYNFKRFFYARIICDMETVTKYYRSISSNKMQNLYRGLLSTEKNTNTYK